MQNIDYMVIFNDNCGIKKLEEENGNKTVNNDLFDNLVALITEYYMMNINK